MWANHVGGTGWESGSGVHVDTWGNVFTTGYFFSPSMTVGTATLTNAGQANIYVVKYNSSGAFISAMSGTPWPANGSLGGISVTTDPAGASVYVVGTLGGDSCSIGTTMLHNMGTSSNSDILVAKYQLPTTVIQNEMREAGINIYPNPVRNVLNIDATNMPVSKVVITNLLGQEVYNMPVGQPSNVQINVASLQPGVYLLRINDTEVRRFVKE